jgi:acetoin utilization deacetylase AcuC-like enzyme
MSGATPSGLLVSTHELCWRHDPGPGHPERAARLTAVQRGIELAGVVEAVRWVEAPETSREAVAAVHRPDLLDRLDELDRQGGGELDADTRLSAHSVGAASRAAGAGLDLIARLDRGEAAVGWSVVRPPGHHATSGTSMGFCLLNNVAVAARHLVARGERVAIVDIDAHHGNGTQDIFYEDPDVLFVSFHQFPLYPHTGRPNEMGSGAGEGTTVNIALPAGTTGDAYRAGIETVLAPVLERFRPTWLLLSVGFDAHRADPITDLGLTAGDYADIVADLLGFAPAGRRLLFLEGGYDLRALVDSAGAVAATVVGASHRPERPTSGGPGGAAVETARLLHVEGRPGGTAGGRRDQP